MAHGSASSRPYSLPLKGTWSHHNAPFQTTQNATFPTWSSRWRSCLYGLTGLTFRTVLIVKIKKTPITGSRRPELKPFNGNSIDRPALRLRALLVQKCTGLAQSDLIGGTERVRTTNKICVHSSAGIALLTTKPHLMTFEFCRPGLCFVHIHFSTRSPEPDLNTDPRCR